MHSRSDDDRLLLPMVSQVILQAVAKVSETRTRLEQMVFVVLKEVLDLLFKGLFDELLGPSLRVLSCFGQLAQLLVLLSVLPLHNGRDLVHKPELLSIVQVRVDVLGDGDEWAWNLAETEAKQVEFEEARINDLLLHLLARVIVILDVDYAFSVLAVLLPHVHQLLLHVAEGVGHGVAKGDFVVLMRLKLIGEAERKVVVDSFSEPVLVYQIAVKSALELLRRSGVVLIPTDFVLLVSDVLPAPKPLRSILLILPLAVDQRFHADLVQRSRLGQVEHIELDLVDLLLSQESDILVDDFEVVPLSIASSVQVVLEPQVVLDV